MNTRGPPWHGFAFEFFLLALDCSSPVGLEGRKVKVTKIKGALGIRNAHDGVLHDGSAYSGLNDIEPVYLQIELAIAGHSITAVAMQSFYSYNQGVFSYYLSYTPTGEQWANYLENGATRMFRGYRDRSTAVKHYLNRPINVRLIRFNPVTWKNAPAFRVELYGCEGTILYNLVVTSTCCFTKFALATARNTDRLKGEFSKYIQQNAWAWKIPASTWMYRYMASRKGTTNPNWDITGTSM